MKKCQKVRKSVKNYETILPFSCCPLVFSLILVKFDLEFCKEGKSAINLSNFKF